jgi:hypothetical protein
MTAKEADYVLLAIRVDSPWTPECTLLPSRGKPGSQKDLFITIVLSYILLLACPPAFSADCENAPQRAIGLGQRWDIAVVDEG